MFLLGVDVILHRVNVCVTDRERRVSVLPSELRFMVVLCPNRGCFFHLLHEVRETMRRAQAEEEMNMVGNTSDGFGDSTKSAHGAAEVFVHLSAPRIAEKRAALFGGENDMVVKAQECGTHRSGMVEDLDVVRRNEPEGLAEISRGLSRAGRGDTPGPRRRN